ncbi:Postreplication repair E3 ubiquitin-protein ligase rad18 [Neolecta irregularis DAH-3]|uniref:Postreplication repair E3 ubiquitin-protein ligase rad18 n=1 Tax=Neolecta irregularis (strain DAH-3) TaxID=1198029 RepID=A0A1U7LI58_NEOID|nr:Postreplication repair E3 ubiquitin-protein ligase rad18 [Neolecta irregularis DAH-3]|eukprot:OLL22337.1 Postreplication repair E3 ubiquitin-protein ligase rad18 [Neolecta irregularis DAH-3]
MQSINDNNARMSNLFKRLWSERNPRPCRRMSEANESNNCADLTSRTKRKPKINYVLLKESNLRKELEKDGISTQGDKAQMIRRHQEWITLWNANVDSSKAKSIESLRQELREWERIQSRASPKNAVSESWGVDNRQEYEELVGKARAGNKRKRG